MINENLKSLSAQYHKKILPINSIYLLLKCHHIHLKQGLLGGMQKQNITTIKKKMHKTKQELRIY